MMYLVIGEAIDPDREPGQMADYIERQVIPSLETMSKMENDNVISAGGIYAGGRIGVAIMNAKSNEELSSTLQSLPFWGTMRWTITPIESYDERAKQARENVDRIRSMTK